MLPDDHGVYKLFPGRNYRFYDDMRDASAVFLDIRGLEALADNPAVWSDTDVLSLIESDRLARELERIADDAVVRENSSGAIDKRNLTFLKGLMLNAKKGDLVLVPGKGYRRDVLIGEFVDDPGTLKRIPVVETAGTNIYLGRAVRWLTGVEKRLIGPDIIERLHTPGAFFAFGESLKDQVYQLAYENYHYRSGYVATFRTTKERFTSADNLITSIWFNGLAATRNAIDTGHVQALEGLSFLETALLPTGAENQNELELNINSPGTILVRSVGVFAFAVMALFPLNVDQAQSVAEGQTRIILRPVGGANDACALQVEAAVADYVRTLGPDKLLNACEFGKQAHVNATLSAKVNLKKGAKAPT